MEREIDTNDRIDGEKIVIYDFTPKTAKDLRMVEIVTPQKKFQYKIRKTRKGRYLFN
jgi:hypothetical protein